LKKGEKYDLVITEVCFEPYLKRDQKLLLKGWREYTRAGITFVVPKLIKGGYDFIIFSNISLQIIKEDIDKIDSENYHGYYWKPRCQPDRLFEIVNELI